MKYLQHRKFLEVAQQNDSQCHRFGTTRRWFSGMREVAKSMYQICQYTSLPTSDLRSLLFYYTWLSANIFKTKSRFVYKYGSRDISDMPRKYINNFGIMKFPSVDSDLSDKLHLTFFTVTLMGIYVLDYIRLRGNVSYLLMTVLW